MATSSTEPHFGLGLAIIITILTVLVTTLSIAQDPATSVGVVMADKKAPPPIYDRNSAQRR